MADRHDRRRKKWTSGPFVRLDLFMMESAAWRSLTPAARAVYTEVRRRYNGSNNGSIALSVRDAAARCNINKDTAAKAFVTLQERGFIECVTPGGFTRKVRHATEWRLLNERCDKTGVLPTKAFMRWRPPEGAERKPRSGSVPNPVPPTRTAVALRVVK
jgi:hypothetical protein